MKRFISWLLAGAALTSCATPTDVRRVETQVRRLREETARADSARAVMLNQILALQRRILDSLALQENRLVAFRGDIRSDLTEVQRQLVQVQELAGQSQQRLTELRGQIEARSQALATAGPRPPGDSSGAAASASSGPGPDQLYELSLQQLRRGSPQTARIGFQKLLKDFPTHDRAGDALFFVGETWGASQPDSAAVAYELVVKGFPNSPRASAALYKLGLLAEQRRDRAAARVYYQRVLAGYPRSEEAPLAREKLQALGR